MLVGRDLPEPQQAEHRADPDQQPAGRAPVQALGHALGTLDGRATGEQEAPQGQAEDGDVDGRERVHRHREREDRVVVDEVQQPGHDRQPTGRRAA